MQESWKTLVDVFKVGSTDPEFIALAKDALTHFIEDVSSSENPEELIVSLSQRYNAATEYRSQEENKNEIGLFYYALRDELPESEQKWLDVAFEYAAGLVALTDPLDEMIELRDGLIQIQSELKKSELDASLEDDLEHDFSVMQEALIALINDLPRSLEQNPEFVISLLAIGDKEMNEALDGNLNLENFPETDEGDLARICMLIADAHSLDEIDKIKENIFESEAYSDELLDQVEKIIHDAEHAVDDGYQDAIQALEKEEQKIEALFSETGKEALFADPTLIEEMLNDKALREHVVQSGILNDERLIPEQQIVLQVLAVKTEEERLEILSKPEHTMLMAKRPHIVQELRHKLHLKKSDKSDLGDFLRVLDEEAVVVEKWDMVIKELKSAFGKNPPNINLPLLANAAFELMRVMSGGEDPESEINQETLNTLGKMSSTDDSFASLTLDQKNNMREYADQQHQLNDQGFVWLSAIIHAALPERTYEEDFYKNMLEVSRSQERQEMIQLNKLALQANPALIIDLLDSEIGEAIQPELQKAGLLDAAFFNHDKVKALLCINPQIIERFLSEPALRQHVLDTQLLNDNRLIPEQQVILKFAAANDDLERRVLLNDPDVTAMREKYPSINEELFRVFDEDSEEAVLNPADDKSYDELLDPLTRALAKKRIEKYPEKEAKIRHQLAEMAIKIFESQAPLSDVQRAPGQDSDGLNLYINIISAKDPEKYLQRQDVRHALEERPAVFIELMAEANKNIRELLLNDESLFEETSDTPEGALLHFCRDVMNVAKDNPVKARELYEDSDQNFDMISEEILDYAKQAIEKALQEADEINEAYEVDELSDTESMAEKRAEVMEKGTIQQQEAFEEYARLTKSAQHKNASGCLDIIHTLEKANPALAECLIKQFNQAVANKLPLPEEQSLALFVNELKQQKNLSFSGFIMMVNKVDPKLLPFVNVNKAEFKVSPLVEAEAKPHLSASILAAKEPERYLQRDDVRAALKNHPEVMIELLAEENRNDLVNLILDDNDLFENNAPTLEGDLLRFCREVMITAKTDPESAIAMFQAGSHDFMDVSNDVLVDAEAALGNAINYTYHVFAETVEEINADNANDFFENKDFQKLLGKNPTLIVEIFAKNIPELNREIMQRVIKGTIPLDVWLLQKELKSQSLDDQSRQNISHYLDTAKEQVWMHFLGELKKAKENVIAHKKPNTNAIVFALQKLHEFLSIMPNLRQAEFKALVSQHNIANDIRLNKEVYKTILNETQERAERLVGNDFNHLLKLLRETVNMATPTYPIHGDIREVEVATVQQRELIEQYASELKDQQRSSAVWDRTAQVRECIDALNQINNKDLAVKIIEKFQGAAKTHPEDLPFDFPREEEMKAFVQDLNAEVKNYDDFKNILVDNHIRLMPFVDLDAKQFPKKLAVEESSKMNKQINLVDQSSQHKSFKQ